MIKWDKTCSTLHPVLGTWKFCYHWSFSTVLKPMASLLSVERVALVFTQKASESSILLLIYRVTLHSSFIHSRLHKYLSRVFYVSDRYQVDRIWGTVDIAKTNNMSPYLGCLQFSGRGKLWQEKSSTWQSSICCFLPYPPNCICLSSLFWSQFA